MRKALMTLIMTVCLVLHAGGQTNLVWRVGQTLPHHIKQDDYARYFRAEEINDTIFRRMWLKSYKRGCTTRRSDLRYLRVVHVNTTGQPQMGELVCHKSIATDLLDIFQELYRARYPIERMVLIDEYDADDETSMTNNNTSCFNYRKVSGTKNTSRHSYGLAIDINPLYNPCVHTRSGKVEPANGKPYAHERAGSKSAPVPLIDTNDLCYKLFTAHGFKWGGAWKNSKDYQHFEKNITVPHQPHKQ